MGRKNLKGTVSIFQERNSIRLRWRYHEERYSTSIAGDNQFTIARAKQLAATIELDMLTDRFDTTLIKYKETFRHEGSLLPHKVNQSTIDKLSFEIIHSFENWTINVKQMNCDVNVNYNAVRNMIRKWKISSEKEALAALNRESINPTTYNRRLSMLQQYGSWMVDQNSWKFNPFNKVCKRKVEKIAKPKRSPLNLNEIKLILNAFKEDTYCSKYSATKHSFYYPFIYFLFKTGVRNAEAIGLKVGHINFDDKIITIKESLARSLTGTSSVQRVSKETKNGKVRQLPLTDDLIEVIRPSVQNKSAEELIFLSPEGKCIDDNNFRSRIFKYILKQLGISERVLYVCRHTFASRCLDMGITPVMTAFMLGNNPETLLRTYTHQVSLPPDLPQLDDL